MQSLGRRSARSRFRPLAVWTGLAAILVLSGCRPADFVVEPYLQNPGSSEMSILWVTSRPEPVELHYGPGDTLDRRATTPVPQLIDASHHQPSDSVPAPAADPLCLYKVRLTGLTPGTRYRYQVSAGAIHAGGTFRTLPDKPEPFTFAAYGDSRSGVDNHRRLALAMAADAHQPAFILHTGDMTSGGFYSRYRSEFFAPLAGVINHIPLLPVPGNHERDAAAYLSLFAFPGTNRWYAFDCANAHFAGLDSTADRQTEKRMRDWLEADLAATKAEWKIVFCHYPSYDSGRHHSEWGRESFVPLFRRHRVDLVIAGHSHGYQRTHPLFKPGENEAAPITYLIAAGGGAPLHDVDASPRLAASARKYHFVSVTINGSILKGRVIDWEGNQIDAFQIAKVNGAFDPAYLTESIPE